MDEKRVRRGAMGRRRMARRLRLILLARRTIDVILAHIRNGGTLIELCDAWQVRYDEVVAWVRADKPRSELYDQALRDRSEWTDEMVLSEIRAICRFDIRKLYDDKGALKAISELDFETARMVQQAEVEEMYSRVGDFRSRVGEKTKVKVYDKLKALELAGRNRKLYTDKQEHDVGGRLEDILSKSYEEPQQPGGSPS